MKRKEREGRGEEEKKRDDMNISNDTLPHSNRKDFHEPRNSRARNHPKDTSRAMFNDKFFEQLSLEQMGAFCSTKISRQRYRDSLYSKK